MEELKRDNEFVDVQYVLYAIICCFIYFHKLLFVFLQNAFPSRIKGFHFYNVGPIFETLITMTKPFLSKKWSERVSYIYIGIFLPSLFSFIPFILSPPFNLCIFSFLLTVYFISRKKCI